MSADLEAVRYRSAQARTYAKGRVVNWMVSPRAVVVALGVAADGNRKILGIEVGDSEDKVF